MIGANSRKQMLEALSNPESLNVVAKDAFDFADKDSNGYIDMKEFELCTQNVSDFFSLQPIKNVQNEFERLDTDKNGVIDFEEFKTFVKEIIEHILSL